MINKDDILTQKEVELLCSQYLDCRLSVLEETELEYLLSKVDYSSPVIDDARLLMGLATASAANVSAPPQPAHAGKRRRRMRYIIECAATIALLFGVGFSLSHPRQSETVYIAYCDGHKANGSQAKMQVEADMKRAEEIMAHVEMLQAQEQEKLNQFMNLNQSTR